MNSVSRSQIGSAYSLTEAQESSQAAIVLLFYPLNRKKIFLWLCFGFWIPTELVIYLFVLVFEWYLNFKWGNSVMPLLGEESRIQIVLITVPKSLLFSLADTYRATQNACCAHHPRHSQHCSRSSTKPGILGCCLSWHKAALGALEEICDCLTWLKLLSPLPLTGSAPREAAVFSWTLCTE